MLATRRRFFEERYCRLLMLETLNQFQHLHQDLETEFILWTFLQHLDLVRQIVDKHFVFKHAAAFQSMLPQKKADRLFVRSLASQEQRLLFDRMLNSQFEDIKRLLKSTSTQLSDEEGFHLFNFFRIKLPELFQEQRKAVLCLLQEQEGPEFSVHALEDFVRDLLQSDFFLNWLQERPEHLRHQEYRQFLREKATAASAEMDQLLCLSLLSMDLFYEKASLFEPEHRQLLIQLLGYVQSICGYMTEAVFVRESFLNALEQGIQSRSKTLYQLEAGLLRPLYDELQTLHTRNQQTQHFLQAQARQTGKQIAELESYAEWENLQKQFKEVNELYARHMGEITQVFHKRLETVEKFKTPSPGSKLKPVFLKKIETCLRYIHRAKREHKPVVIKYLKWPEATLAAQQENFFGNMFFENDYEKLIAQRAFEKARNILSGLHQSKGTVKLNMRLLFGEQLRKETCFSLFQEILVELWSLALAQPDETTDFLVRHLELYLKGLGVPENLPPSGMSAYERAGYILAFLAQSEQIKLLVDLKNHQLIYDWNSLFNLAHAFMMLSSRLSDSHASFEEHFRNTMDSAWNCLTQYCLFAGSGQYNQLANPLSLFDYSYAEALDEYGSPPVGTESAAEAEGFSLLHLEAPPEKKALPAGRRGSSSRALVPVSQKETVGAYDEGPSIPDAEDEHDDEYGMPLSRKTHAGPGRLSGFSEPSRRRLIPPASSGKLEIYSAPTRRPMGGGQILPPEEDDFYKLMGATYAGQNTAGSNASPPASPPAPRPPGLPAALAPVGEDPPFYRSRGAAAAEPPAAEPPALPFYRSRGASVEEPAAPSAVSPPKGKRERWLELTPQPHRPENYDDILDHILTSSQQPGAQSPPAAKSASAAKASGAGKAPDPTNDQDYNKLVEDILKRNRFDPDASISTGETISSHNKDDLKAKKRRPGF
ncbi:hypothetical protein COW36_21495 [bacterium (Candidatus Blackallbacteria) CG17_big_fil_post_rev_8_21_14_2_50_48_46]|uniref:Uncharacterized protein n=1 Tax=bacterium (Candidatus Blackallbacteria) CG17_big_fil_post_rev_8_21_14_2_50_48_46 TaxID=2014261 RepID=A0A2M7FZ17_9BACT|nr:MAG: hypothetical protein COW64_14795 [bacterium (Candidatus Blackallbacteria) CG18_big_fil_WC_8_21_14_2_50_49_26]PIW14614.1 MAG: hypothetical protein COW36_21495 [bacterium (Candidatus Blackallbacteria) CG17_big_fil_post_rev_8_21_14_2_50_48_46]PIW45665.1 MAG: hypothetical protein COW20_19325 [bacterium (Candidatus Blackallbacteria) CG13_big_fil_rev_8_21_14_2_50_49_14]